MGQFEELKGKTFGFNDGNGDGDGHDNYEYRPQTNTEIEKIEAPDIPNKE